MIILGILAAVFIAVLLFALVTGRIDWRQQGCCAVSDPARDARLRDPGVPSS